MQNQRPDSSGMPMPSLQNATDSFFPGAGREALCEEIVLALMSGRRFLSLGGDAGSGKSLCCQIIMERLPPDWIPVYLNRPANSYEELLRQACIDLGTTGDSRRPGFSWPDEFNRQVLARQADLHKVLLILDQDEQLFSAILERLLDRCRHTGDLIPEFALLLVCPDTLMPVLEQLARLDPANRPDSMHVLLPMTAEESEQYLRFLLHAAGIHWDKHEAILNRKSCAAIFGQAKGNIARSKEMAATLLAQALPALAPNAAKAEAARGGAAATEAGQVAPPLAPASSAAEEALPARGAEAAPKSAGISPPKAAPAVPQQEKSAGGGPPLEREDRPREEQAAGSEADEPLDGNPLLLLYDLLTANKKLLAALLTAAGLFCMLGLRLEFARPGSGGRPAETVLAAPQAAKAAPESNPAAPAPPAEEAAGPRGATLLEARLAASTALVASSYRGASTIHVLTLNSENAGQELAGLLEAPAFFREEKQLYIIKKEGNPVSYFVFYGIFDTPEAARQARNNLSFELRAHHPYPLSVAEALQLNGG